MTLILIYSAMLSFRVCCQDGGIGVDQKKQLVGKRGLDSAKVFTLRSRLELSE